MFQRRRTIQATTAVHVMVIAAPVCLWLSSACGSAQPSLAATQAVVVLSSEAAPYRKAAAALNQQLAEYGWQITTVQFDALDDVLMDLLLAEKPQVVTAIGSEAATSLHRRLPREVPLTYCMVSDLEAAGLAATNRAFGVSTDIPLKEQFAIIAEALPRTRTLGMLYQSESSRSRNLLEQVRREMPESWRLVAISLSNHASVAEAVDALFRESIDVVWTAADSSVYDAATVRALLLSSVRRKVPVFGFSAGFVRAGALLGTSIDPTDQGAQCAELTHQLVQGKAINTAEPEQRRDLHGAHSPRYQIVINLVVAEMIGVQLPESLSSRAHQVIRPE